MSQADVIDAWAEKVWKKNIRGWEQRNQDFNYRKYLARPGMKELLRYLPAVSNGVFLDLGCGDGSEMRQIKKCLMKKGNSGTFFGFDLQGSLINLARKKDRIINPIGSVYDHGLLEELVLKHNLEGNVDRVFSTFLVQELSDAESLFAMVSRCLKKGGQGVFLILHPMFGDAMLRKGALKINDQLESTHWRWAAEYPIVEEDGKTFYVPYFHRKLEDYKKILNEYFSVFFCDERKPSETAIQECQLNKLSPFYDHPGNVYYPEIIDIPSSLFLVFIK